MYINRHITSPSITTFHFTSLLLLPKYIVNYFNISHACPVKVNVGVTISIYGIFSSFLTSWGQILREIILNFLHLCCIFNFEMAAAFHFGPNSFALLLSFASSIFLLLFTGFTSPSNSSGYKH